MPRLRLVSAYLAVVLGLTVLLYALPERQLWCFVALGAAGVTAVVVGVLRHRPRLQLPWWLLAAAMLMATLGITWWRWQLSLGRTPVPPSVTDALLLMGFVPLALAGLAGLIRAVLASRDREGWLDTLILTAGTCLLAWTFLIQPFIRLLGLTATHRGLAVGYLAAGVLILATIMRLAGVTPGNPAAALLVTGGLGQLAAGAVFSLAELGAAIPALQVGSLLQIGFYAAWGTAALHPAMRVLTEPHPTKPVGLSQVRLLALVAAGLLAPAALAVQVITGDVWGSLIAAALTTAVVLLVLVRVTGALAVSRRVVARERALRRAGAALVEATTVAEVAAAVTAAVAQLLPPRTPHRVAVQEELGRKGRAVPPDVPSAGVLAPQTVDPEIVGRLGAPEAVLCHRLVVIDETGAPVRVGALYIGAPRRSLMKLQTATGVLANQAALALERIRLTSEVKQRASEEYFRTLVQNASDMIIILEEDDTVRYASPSVARTLGGVDITGQNLFDAVRPEDRAAAVRLLTRLREDPERRGARGDWTLTDPSGRQLQVEVRCRDLRDEPTVGGLVLALRDVSEQRRLERQLTHRAYHDALTGLPNRALFQQRLEAALSEGGRDGVVGVLMLDLDDFKVVNDTLGHAAGDELLVQVADRLTGLLRPVDTAARLGGDEFGALVTDAGSPEDIEQIAERVVRQFAHPFELGGVAVSSSVTVGLATSRDAATARDLLRHADLALYVAKQSGKGQWRRYRPADHAGVLRRMELRSALSHAVATGAFELEYQPIVALESGRAVGMEALVRWRHPVRGPVPPAEFIDVAEETGLIVPIGGWVLTRALAHAATWAAAGDDGPYLSVNVSARQFRQPGFVATVRRTLETTGLSPSRLVIEITESALMREPVWSELVALRDLGVRVAIDDFGTGYSSLSYLRQLPVDLVKLEKSFLTTITSSASQLAVVEGILTLADRLGLVVVAEGVDREEVRDQLLRSGCRYGQGFLFARPLPAGEASAWVQDATAA